MLFAFCRRRREVPTTYLTTGNNASRPCKKPVLSGVSLNTRVPIRVVSFHYYFCLLYWHIGKIVWKKPVSLSYMHNFAINFRIHTRTYAPTSITGFSIFTRRQKYRVNSIAILNEKKEIRAGTFEVERKEKNFFSLYHDAITN